MGILSSIISSITGAAQQASQNRFNAEESAKQRLFAHREAQLSFARELGADSTKYQRQVADMQAAGLNPMLAVSSGAGSVSSSPASGSAASAASVGNLGSLLLEGQRLDIDKSLADAQIEKIDAETRKIASETEGQELENSLFRDTMDVKKVLLGDEHERNQWEKEIGLRGVSVKESNQKMLETQAEHYNNLLDEQAGLISEQKVSESVKREMYRANARESNANAIYKAAMLEVDKMYREASTEEARKQANLLGIEARIKNGIYTPAYIKAICEDAKAMSEYHEIMTAYSKGDYSAASKSLRAVFEEGERLGKNYGISAWAENHGADAYHVIPALN